jgi:hypothetical protein
MVSLKEIFNMYSHRKGLILGFHGCEKAVRDKIVSVKGKILQNSENGYDWLGKGCYFWENSPERAMDYALFLKNSKKKIEEPAVLGCVIDLGLCFDLTELKYLKYLRIGYEHLRNQNKPMPENKTVLKDNPDLLLRYLDCAVIETSLEMFKEEFNIDFDSVRGMFFEGEDLYPNSGFKTKNHIQIAIRNHNCIKGYFIPRELDSNQKIV